MTDGAYGQTSGSDSRDSRPTMERLMVFNVAEEIERLRGESPWTDGDRNSVTLAKEIDFRVLLSVLRDGAALEESNGDARVSVQLVEGRASLQVGGRDVLGAVGAGNLGAGDVADLEAGDLATIDAGQPWTIRASGDCALLLTLAWPREKAAV